MSAASGCGRLCNEAGQGWNQEPLILITEWEGHWVDSSLLIHFSSSVGEGTYNLEP